MFGLNPWGFWTDELVQQNPFYLEITLKFQKIEFQHENFIRIISVDYGRLLDSYSLNKNFN